MPGIVRLSWHFSATKVLLTVYLPEPDPPEPDPPEPDPPEPDPPEPDPPEPDPPEPVELDPVAFAANASCR